MALFYPFSMTDNGIYTQIFETEIFFKFIVPLVPKDIHLLKEISIFKGMSTDGIEPATDTIATIDPMADNAINSTQ